MSGSNSKFFVDPNQSLTVAENGNPSFTGVQFHTSAQALPIPIVFGTRRVSPQMIWVASVIDDRWGHFDHGGLGPYNLSNPAGYDTSSDSLQGPFFGQLGGGSNFLGSTDLTSSASSWFVPVLMSVCEGPVDDIQRIWNGGGSAAMTWAESSATPLLNGVGSPACPFYDKTLNGTSTQTAWAFIHDVNSQPPAPLYPGQELAYRFTALIATPTQPWGHNNSPPQQAFEVVRTPNIGFRKLDSYGIGYDYSPREIIVDLLTSTQYGMGLGLGDIDSTSSTHYRDYVGAMGLYLSVLLNAQTAGTDIIDRIANETNTWIFWSGTALYFVPLGDESITANGFAYVADTSVAYDLRNNDFLAPLQVNRADPIDCFNRVRFEFPDRRPGIDGGITGNNSGTSTPGVDYGTNAMEWRDDTLVNLYGIRDASNVSADDICDAAVAAISLDLYAKRMAYIRNTYTFTLSMRFIRILPGCIVTLTEPNIGLDHVPVRVRSIEEDEGGNLSIVAEEYTGTLGIARAQSQQAWLPNGIGGGGGSGSGSGGGGGGGSGGGVGGGGGGIGGGLVGGVVSTWGGDLATSTSTQQWVSSISGPHGDGTETVIDVDRLNFGSDQDPTLEQDATGQTLGEAVIFGGQDGVNANFSPGDVYVKVPASRGSGLDAYFKVVYGTPEIPMFAVRPHPSFGRGWVGLWAAGPDAGIAFAAGNPFLFLNPNGDLFFNAGYTFFGHGAYNFGFGELSGGAQSITFSDFGVQFFNAALAGGTGVFAIGNAVTPAAQNTLATTGGVFHSIAQDGLHWISPVKNGGVGERGFDVTVAPAATGAVTSQRMQHPRYVQPGQTTSAGTVVQTVIPPSSVFGTSGRMLVEVVGRTATAGATGAIGDTCTFLVSASYRYVGAGVTILGSPRELDSYADPSLIGATVSVTSAGATYLVTATAPTNAGAVVDWTIHTTELRS